TVDRDVVMGALHLWYPRLFPTRGSLILGEAFFSNSSISGGLRQWQTTSTLELVNVIDVYFLAE
ncbi:MAG: hypothetical protein PWK00_11350, partial [Coxiella burnetii]|nr:hypothetical protein [Coxiella burnetii]